jgi:S-adenosyl-L-methionine hydrolase (adenosine-forming)
MPHPLGLITLLTDFGDRDSFVASMKGVILTINPHATLVDLSHHVPPHSVEDAAYLLKSCYRYFPRGTVHVAVVDPGVGSARRPLIAKSEHYFFLAPDNGLLTPILAEDSEMEVREIENADYRLTSPGHTFDGRDLFAPAVAWLTKGEPLASFGRLVNDPVRFPLDEPVWQDQRLVGHIVYVDRFGNLISNIMRKHLEEVGAVTKHPTPEIHIAQQTIKGLVVSYSEGEGSRPAALLNSSGFLEIFVKEGSAAEELGLKSGALITVA